MKNRTCALFLFDGYADWEPALAIAGLNKYSDVAIKTFSVSGRPVTSMGGLVVTPQQALSTVRADNIDLLLIPGGEAWEVDKEANREIGPLVQALQDRQKPVAAICGATILLAEMGLLDALPHTSNGPGYLEAHCPSYRGTPFFRQQPCVAAGGIITANGAAMIEFAGALYGALGIFDEITLEGVQELYKSGGMVNKLQAEGSKG
jgi:putative intracellular protease/amidase